MVTQKDKAEQFKRDLRSWHFYEGMIQEYDLKLEEIAVVLDLNVNTVKARLYRALKKLRIELEPEMS